MSVRGLFETHLTVADLERSVAFYRDVVGLPVALELPERGAAFHWIGRPGQAMLGLWSIGSAPMGMRLHVAFEMALADVHAAPERLRADGIQPLSFFGESTDEPSVIGWMPAFSKLGIDRSCADEQHRTENGHDDRRPHTRSLEFRPRWK